ncbi:hypothetical protein AB1Y20_011394 [Prymnesium parvum]|uniref:NADH dehydrogenase [ubiquinone] iron-sulfur protein 5 n=1 Tax=Prymnesium parvum TaxID=97485 RepID=A0AB34IPF5_PRYPA|mmetsp:Transcript_35378/g.88067  ORF Transcript_35378/g.88067 Transcript_35378/m.88067 type:complete len:94 (-) Transcript_35378:356-637(-)
MASGYGSFTPMGRCFPLFREFSNCAGTSLDREACRDYYDDYIECLHHKKENTYLNEITKTRLKKIKDGEEVPPTIPEQVQKGAYKIPFTNFKE